MTVMKPTPIKEKNQKTNKNGNKSKIISKNQLLSIVLSCDVRFAF